MIDCFFDKTINNQPHEQMKMSRTINNLRGFVSYICYECTSNHIMRYTDDRYVCEECYREEAINCLARYTCMVDWTKLSWYILLHPTPKTAIRMFLVKILKEPKYDEEKLQKLQNTTIFDIVQDLETFIETLLVDNKRY